jgi:hypothetical protein
MQRLIADEPWAKIELDVEQRTVLLTEDWYYKWLNPPWVLAKDFGGHIPWTPGLQSYVHRNLLQQIRKIWNGRVVFSVSGDSALAARLRGGVLRFKADIRWVQTQPAHWTVRMWMVGPEGSFASSSARRQLGESFQDAWPNVNHTDRIITLNTGAWYAFRAPRVDQKHGPKHFAFAHEFGHTLAPLSHFQDDEYFMSSPHYADVASIMNVGSQIRAHHLAGVIEVLEKLAPGTKFHAEIEKPSRRNRARSV